MPRAGARSHPSRGAWIEMIMSKTLNTPNRSRTPHGVRGLKLTINGNATAALKSHPSRGAWIEICAGYSEATETGSHPSRGAWIEIFHYHYSSRRRKVAPLTGCVD